MDLRDVVNSGKARKRRRRYGRGRGSGRGKFCSRGHRGARQRSGASISVLYEGGNLPLFRRIPKRGFNNNAFRKSFEVVNVGMLARFPAGSVVGPEEMTRARLLTRDLPAKVLVKGDLKIALTVKAHAFSTAARQAIEKAGGKAEVIR